ncbi:MAG: hypothetical protein ACFFDW_00245 [Candidatus Thorarchaeota archaeon]
MKKKEKQSKETTDSNEIEYISGDTKKKVILVEDSAIDIYNRKKINLQLVSLAMVLVIFIISPLRLLDSRTIIDITAIGFITASLVPSLIAIFGFLPGRKFCLYISSFIYAVWIIVLATFYLEIILLIVVLIIYLEVTSTIIAIDPLLKDVEANIEGGAHYHASVVFGRYFKFLLRFSGILFASSLILGVVGWYAIEALQGDILFSIFILVSLVLLIVIIQKTLTPDLKEVLVEERRRRMEMDFADSYSKYS